MHSCLTQECQESLTPSLCRENLAYGSILYGHKDRILQMAWGELLLDHNQYTDCSIFYHSQSMFKKNPVCENQPDVTI